MKKYKLLIILFGLVLSNNLYAQKITFLKTYNDKAWSIDKGWALEADGQGYTIGTGSYCEKTKTCFKIIRTDLEGTEQWTNIFYQPPPNFIRLSPDCAIRTQDGSFMVAGDIGLPTGENEAFLYKVNAQGDSLWMRFYESPATDFARNLFELPNGDLLLHVDGDQQGVTTGRKGLMKTDKDGNIIWRHDYLQDTFVNNQQGNLTILRTGEFLMTYWSSHKKHLYEFNQVTKLNKDGKLLWSKVYDMDPIFSNTKILELNNGNYVMMSSKDFYTKQKDYGPVNLALTVLDTTGNIIWQKFVYTSVYQSYFTDMELTPEGDIVLIGNKHATSTSPVYRRPWVLKLSPTLDVIWERLIDLPERKDQERFSLSDLVITPSGNLAISGTIDDVKGQTGLHAALLVLDSNGCITSTCDSLQLITEVTEIAKDVSEQTVFRLFPNPTQGQSTIHFEEAMQGKIEVRNLLGALVFKTTMTAVHDEHIIDLTPYPNGVYYVTITDQKRKNYTKKLIKLF